MARAEKFKPRFHGKGPNGRPLCVWCGKETPVGRRRWCSQRCVREMKIRHWPGEWSWEVIKRDKGVCRLCGFDGAKVGRILRRLRNRWATEADWPPEYLGAYRFYWDVLVEQGFNRQQTLVEADHVVPIVEGGENTLENGRTLCVPCHKAETAKLAARRKWERRRTKTLFVMQ